MYLFVFYLVFTRLTFLYNLLHILSLCASLHIPLYVVFKLFSNFLKIVSLALANYVCRLFPIDIHNLPSLLVEDNGIEPLTPCLQSRCSPS
jgi:hypothetical protein